LSEDYSSRFGVEPEPVLDGQNFLAFELFLACIMALLVPGIKNSRKNNGIGVARLASAMNVERPDV
jgi:hypothetical protein